MIIENLKKNAFRVPDMIIENFLFMPPNLVLSMRPSVLALFVSGAYLLYYLR